MLYIFGFLIWFIFQYLIMYYVVFNFHPSGFFLPGSQVDQCLTLTV